MVKQKRSSARAQVARLLAAMLILFSLWGATPAHAVGSFDNGLIASKAEAYRDGYWYGWCKVFVNDMVSQASGGTIALSGYQDGFARYGTEVSSAQAARGDVIQVAPSGTTDATVDSVWDADHSKPLHTAIILSNNGNGDFWVIDSNWNNDMKVLRHSFNPYTWAAAKTGGGIVKIWRLGTVSSSSPSAKPAARATNIISGAIYTVFNANSGKVVDVAGAATSNGTRLQQYKDNGTAAQKFRFIATSNGYYQIKSALDATKVWDVSQAGTTDGSKTHIWTYGGGNNQQWQPVYVGNGLYEFHPRHVTSKCLDVPGASTSDSVQLQIWSCNGSGAQRFWLLPRG